jgi:hypothetical protein
MTALLEMEEFVDNCSAVFMERLGEFAQNKQMFDLGHWLQCYAVGFLPSLAASLYWSLAFVQADLGYYLALGLRF